MRKKIKSRKTEMSVMTKNVTGIMVSSGIGFTTTFMLTLIASLILMNSSVLSSSSSVYFISSVAIGAIVAGFIASKKCEFKGIVSGIIASLPIIILDTISMLIFSNGRLIPGTAILYVGIIIFSAIGGIASANTKRKK